MKRDILNSPRLKEIQKRRQKVLFRKMILFCVLLIFIFAIFTYVSSLPKLNINNIEIVGNKITDTELIKSAIQSELTGKYIFLFPKTNIFFYPKNKIKERLEQDFKRLVNINLSIKDENTLEVVTEERKGEFVWCGEAAPTKEILVDEKCYFMDDSGFIFDEAPYFSGDVYFKFYGSILGNVSNKINPTGLYFEKENFPRLISLKKMLEETEVDMVSLYKSTDENMKIYLSSKSSLPFGPEILIKIDSDFKKIVENLQSALSTEPLLSDFKNKYSSLLYLDLRFGNKVYFKFK